MIIVKTTPHEHWRFLVLGLVNLTGYGMDGHVFNHPLDGLQWTIQFFFPKAKLSSSAGISDGRIFILLCFFLLGDCEDSLFIKQCIFILNIYSLLLEFHLWALNFLYCGFKYWSCVILINLGLIFRHCGLTTDIE